VARKVVADMFGLALRSYQQKVQRLNESATDRGRSLWEGVLRFIQDAGTVSRARVLSRFSNDDSATVRGILNDLVGSGLVYRTGRGDQTVYRLASTDDVGRALAEGNAASEVALVWLGVYREGPINRSDLLDRIRIASSALDAALEQLLAEGRIHRGEGSDPTYSAESCVIPLGEPAGWEAAFIDHYQAMVGALCAKLASLAGPREQGRNIGGSTLSFDVWPGHPHADQVVGLLARMRSDLCVLWDEVHAHNTKNARPAEYQKVTFYFGQNVRVESREAE
jgi:hypothetical protein